MLPVHSSCIAWRRKTYVLDGLNPPLNEVNSMRSQIMQLWARCQRTLRQTQVLARISMRRYGHSSVAGTNLLGLVTASWRGKGIPGCSNSDRLLKRKSGDHSNYSSGGNVEPLDIVGRSILMSVDQRLRMVGYLLFRRHHDKRACS